MSSAASGPESDAPAVELRASVLDAAISLGFRNSMMAKWMFDPVTEAANDEDEAAEHGTPGLTSPSTSEESAMSPYNYRPPAQPVYEYPRLGNKDEQAFKPGSNDQIFVNPAPGNVRLDNANRMGPVKLTLAVPPTKERRNKLRKQKSGYESDGGYVSGDTKKAKKNMWKKKDSGDDYESDGAYLSEANTKKTKRKAKDKEKGGNGEDTPSPVGDPGALLATINASFLSGPELGADDYLTDSGGADAKRGRTKKPKNKDKRSRTRPSSPAGEEDASNMPAKTKKSLFRLMTRSVSRDAKDRDRDGGRRLETETPPPPPPVPPMPPMPLPIAERFARAGTPTLAIPSSLSVPPGLVKSSSSMELSSPSSTLVPPNDVLRSESPWSYRSAPSRMGTTNEMWGGEHSRPGTQESLDLSREDSSGTSTMSHSTEEGNKMESLLHGLSRSLSRSISPTIASPGDLGGSPSKKRGRFFPFGNSSSNGVTSKFSTASISGPNPHLAQRESTPLPNPFDIAAALTSRAFSSANGTGTSNVNLKNVFQNSSQYDQRAASPESFIMIGEDEGVPTPVRQRAFEDANAVGNEPSTSYLSSPVTTYGPPGSPSSPMRPGLAVRRGAPGRALSPAPLNTLDLTPTQSRAGTPNPDEFMAARANVLAYYQVPPPSPPPTGPLPPPPLPPSSSLASPVSEGDALPLRRPSEDRQLLSPGRALASRSPSPLGLGARYSRSPSPGLGQLVRRGKESPFPTRPVLAPQSSRQLVERVERYKALYSTEVGEGLEERGDFEEERDYEAEVERGRASVYASSEEFIDTRSSTYIRQARARGEKRVYFDVSKSGEEDAFPTDVSATTPEIELDAGGGYFDDIKDERLRYVKTESGSGSDAGEGEPDRRSLASTSVYSRYSVLDEEKSAQVRNGLVRHVAALYGQDRDEIPAVPQVPAGLRDAGFAGRPEKGILKITSSPYRF